MGDAPVICLTAAQPNLCALAAPPQSTRLPPLVSTGPRSYLPNRGLPGVEPEQPKPPKMTASTAGPTLPPRCRSRPATLPPPQDAYQLQLCRARRAISPRFPISPALLHQHHAQPRRFLQHRSRSARACMCWQALAFSGTGQCRDSDFRHWPVPYWIFRHWPVPEIEVGTGPVPVKTLDGAGLTRHWPAPGGVPTRHWPDPALA